LNINKKGDNYAHESKLAEKTMFYCLLNHHIGVLGYSLLLPIGSARAQIVLSENNFLAPPQYQTIVWEEAFTKIMTIGKEEYTISVTCFSTTSKTNFSLFTRENAVKDLL